MKPYQNLLKIGVGVDGKLSLGTFLLAEEREFIWRGVLLDLHLKFPQLLLPL